MFRKLISNLPFNPSLITQVSFYGARLRQEKAIRRVSMLFIASTMVLQTFAVVVPPAKSLVSSSNHILDGLTTSKSPQQNKDFLLQSWDSSEDIRAIYQTFGVSRDDIASIEPKTVTIFSGDADYWTIGRNSLYGYSKVEQRYKDSQVTIQYAGLGTATTADDKFVYNRQLRAWDIVNRAGNYKVALKGTIKATGETFWILYDCGNLTKLTQYTPPPPPPPPPPVNEINAICRIIGPIVVARDATTASIPVEIGLPSNRTIPAGGADAAGNGPGLHLGVTTVGLPTTWNNPDANALNQLPPDKQTNYVPLASNTQGVGYYEFVWNKDNTRYRRYFVAESKSGPFSVRINVQLNDTSRKVAVRLLDRELGKWLPHDSGCEAEITREAPPQPPPPEPPAPEVIIEKNILNKPAFAKPGDPLTYSIQYRNTVNGSIAQNVTITDQLDLRYFDVVSVSPSSVTVTNGFLKLERGALPFSTDFEEIRVSLKLKDQISSGTSVCNVARITASNAGSKDTSLAPTCIGVLTPCPYNDSIADINNPNCSEPKVVCSVLDASINRTLRRVTFKTTATSTNQPTTKLLEYSYDFGDGSPTLKNTSASYTDEATHTYSAGEFVAKVTVRYTAQGVEGVQEAACSVAVSFEEDQALGKSKTVKNITKDRTGDAALTTNVGGGDVLEYRLVTTNIQNYERREITVSDSIGDVLDYAVIDEAFLQAQGGTYDPATKKVVWKDLVLPAQGEHVASFRVTIKSPVPSTNTPSGMTTNFDCKISNNYGNEITINVDCPLVKGLETLPKTGPGSSLFAVSTITVLIGYFFARSRLLEKEISIVKREYAVTGGM